MAGRWAVLAIHACRTGALDYSRVSQKDPRSLFAEALILDDIERDWYADYFATLAKLHQDPVKSLLLIKEALAAKMPWMGSEMRKPEAVRLEQRYHELIGDKSNG